MRYESIQGDSGPICPLYGIHQAHLDLVLQQDLIYYQFVDRETKEIPDDKQDAYKLAEKTMLTARQIYGNPNRMRLYSATAKPESLLRAYVESWFFKCLVCHTILPANRVQL